LSSRAFGERIDDFLRCDPARDLVAFRVHQRLAAGESKTHWWKVPPLITALNTFRGLKSFSKWCADMDLAATAQGRVERKKSGSASVQMGSVTPPRL